ncbi:ABC transporter substrate-binding protein [Demequina gelatinilytica]|uniref:ABC transporter substrate-binding protein n=1 Tax=Demequina gelatinilytica TaxID=1638980 RepID=UPI000AF3A3C4|nr:ABC transporter substrate-binding protein [Demequina gelatinilytica]
MSTITRGIGAAAAVALLGLSLAACASSGEEAGSSESAAPLAAVDGGSLVYASDVQPITGGLDPYLASAFANMNATVQIYEPLLAKDADGTIIPWLAESWEQVDDLTYTFTLRDGVTFSDGSPLTVEDVIFSIESMRASAAGAANFATLGEVTALDDSTVQITTVAPDATLINVLAYRGSAIVSKAWYEAATEEERQQTAMGTGPFVLDTWTDQVSMTFTANESYWGEAPSVDTLEFDFIGDENARAAQLRQGSGTDMAWFRDPTQVSSLEEEGYTVGQNAATRSLTMYINATDGPLADVKVRQAVSKAMDRQALIDFAMGGLAEPSLVVPAGDPWGIEPDESTPNYTHDVDGAKALLAEAGETSPTIQLTYASDAAFALDVPMVEVLQQQLAEAGITLELVGKPWTEVLQSYIGGTWTDLLLVPGVYQPDPASYFSTVLTPGLPMATTVTAESPEVALYMQLRSTFDEAERAEILAQLETAVAENVNVLVAYTGPQRYEVWGDTVTGYEVDPYTYREGLAATAKTS